jgi:hypothetical protein
MRGFYILLLLILSACTQENAENVVDNSSGLLFTMDDLEVSPQEKNEGRIVKNIKLTDDDMLFISGKYIPNPSIWEDNIEVAQIKIRHGFSKYKNFAGIEAFKNNQDWHYKIFENKGKIEVLAYQRFVKMDRETATDEVQNIPFKKWVISCDDIKCTAQSYCLAYANLVKDYDLGFTLNDDFKMYLHGINAQYNANHHELAGQKPDSINEVLMSAFAGNRAAWKVMMDFYAKPIKKSGRIDFEHEFEGDLRESIRKAAKPFSTFMLQNDCQPS